MSTNVPAIQFLPTGLSVPTEGAVLTGVQQDMNGAFGATLNYDLRTSQGQWASAQSAAIAAGNAVFAAIVNGIDPDTAIGFMQDAIARINFLTRNPGVATVVQCTCTGAVGTVIQTGVAQAQDTSGNLYQCTQGGTIGSGGTVSLTFANVVVGPIACPANTLTIISQGAPGWESITNPAPGVVGANIETPAALEYRRRNSVAGNSQGFAGSVYGAVFSIANVIDVFVYENDTSGAVTYGATNFSLAANSIYVGVIGGDPIAIAQAIWNKKSPGCNYNGNTTEDITDTSGNYQTPPVYPVKLNNNSENPANTYFSVLLTNSPTLPSNITTLVQNAIVNQFTGGVATLPRARIASTIAGSDYTSSVQTCVGTTPALFVQVLSIEIGTTFAGDATWVNGSTTLTVTTATSGQLTFGTVVSSGSSGLPAGTYIQQQLTGTTGGVGTYQMSAQATATQGSAVALTGAPGESATYGIDQAPVTATGNITVALS
jgi:hypothetical protein